MNNLLLFFWVFFILLIRKFGVDAQNVQKKKGSETTKSKTQSLMKNKLSYRSSDSVNRCQELSENGDVILRTDNLYYVSYYEPPLPSEKLLVNIRHTNDEINPDGSKGELENVCVCQIHFCLCFIFFVTPKCFLF